MADTKVLAAEPDPAATSLPNDQTVAEKLGGKAVEAAKEPVETPAEEISKVQAAKDEKATDSKKVEAAEAIETDVKDKREKSSEHGEGARNNDHRKPNDKKSDRRNKPNNGRFTRTNHSKFDPSSLPVTDDPDEIRKQVEFYFSDSNLPLDKFLFEQVGGSQNKPFPVKQLHTFKRMKRFQPYSAVLQALKESDVLDVTDDEQVKRKVPLDSSLDDRDNNLKIMEDEAMPRSVYVKGFGEESADTQFAIEAFFAPYGPTRAIRLRRAPDRTFKGSVFVEFESDEAAKQFLDLDPAPKFHQMTLDIKSKKAYCEQKVEDIKSGKIKANGNNRGNLQRNGKFGNRNNRDTKHNGNRRDDRNSNRKSDSRGHDYRNGEDDRDWRTRRDEDRKKQDKAAKKDGAEKIEEKSKSEAKSGEVPATNSLASEDSGAAIFKKRGRDEDEEESAPAKKTKMEEQATEKVHDAGVAVGDGSAASAPEATAESNGSKKRGRDEDKEEAGPTKKAKTQEPTIEQSKNEEDKTTTTTGKKRGRDDDEEEFAPAKKVNAEHTETATAGKKRGRDEDEEGEGASTKKAKAEEQKTEKAS